MTPQEASEVPWVRCSCCGQDIPDDEEHNASFGEIPNPHDTGFGMCIDCGGDKKAGLDEPKDKPLTESAVKRRLGWAGRMFYEARFETLGKSLRPDLAEKFQAMTYAKKVTIVSRMVERGLMI